MSELGLVPLSAEEYAREVLPHSAELWAYGHDFERYVGDFHRTARSPYGKRRFRAVGLRIDGRLVSSCKRYERELHCAGRTFRAVGIGALFTLPALRGRGYASALIGALLDAERAAGTETAFLFSDIHPHFYERLGFVALPSRMISIRASSLGEQRIDALPITKSDLTAVHHCFDLLEQRRAFGLRRTPLVWDWIHARRAALGSVDLAVKRGRAVAAYVLGRREVGSDAYVLEEFGFADDTARPLIPPLLRAATGDLRKVVGWLPPNIAREAIPSGAVKRRHEAITMIAPLSDFARARWRAVREQILSDRADRVWATDAI
jgi:predicted N-acetyltransferase YhbS